jgi:hypothetical protein
MTSDTTKQQRGVLLVALLGIRKLQSNSKPTRKQVLAFIRNANLIAWNEHEIEWSDANCSIGENRISWRRKDFVMDGILKPGPSKPSWTTWHLQAPGRTEYGIWELTEVGVTKITNVVKDWSEKFDKNPQFFDEIKVIVPELKLTDEFMNLVLQLAHDNFKIKFFPRK